MNSNWTKVFFAALLLNSCNHTPTQERDLGVLDSDLREEEDFDFNFDRLLTEKAEKQNPEENTKPSGFGQQGIAKISFGYGDDEANSMVQLPNGMLLLVGSTRTTETSVDFALARSQPNGELDKNFGKEGKVTFDLGHSKDYAYSAIVLKDGKIVVAGIQEKESSTKIALVRFLEDGKVDSNFGQGGLRLSPVAPNRLLTSLGSGKLEFGGLRQQKDKLVVGGILRQGTQNHLFLGRFLEDGSPDPTFGENGFSLAKIPTLSLESSAMAQLQDGDIVVMGTGETENLNRNAVGSKNRDIYLVRFSSDGKVEKEFGIEGIAKLDLGTYFDMGRSLTPWKDGFLLVGQRGITANTTKPIVARISSNGVLDTRFGSSGIVELAVNETGHSSQALVVEGKAPKILVGATVTVGTRTDFTLFQLNENGSADPSFGTEGMTSTAVGLEDNRLSAIGISSDGKITALGTYQTGGYGLDFAVVRYLPNGSLDN